MTKENEIIRCLNNLAEKEQLYWKHGHWDKVQEIHDEMLKLHEVLEDLREEEESWLG